MDTDQGVTSSDAGGSQGQSGDQSPSDAGDQFVLDVGTSKYRDMDAVKAGVQEKDRTIAELSKRLSEMQSQTANTEAIAAIARKLTTPEPQVQKQVDYDGEIAQLSAKLEDADSAERTVITRKIARLEVEQLLNPKIAEIDALKAKIEDLQRVTAEHDPDWVASRDIAAQLSQEWGFDPNDPNDRATLKRMVAKKRAEQAQLPRVRPSGGVGSSTGIRSSSGDLETEQQAAALANGVASYLNEIGIKTNPADLKKKFAPRRQ